MEKAKNVLNFQSLKVEMGSSFGIKEQAELCVGMPGKTKGLEVGFFTDIPS